MEEQRTRTEEIRAAEALTPPSPASPESPLTSSAPPVSPESLPASPAPLVSISCISYNQEAYLRQTFDSFLMQKDVSFEILIHDDASTDRSQDIIREYERAHPGIFRSVLQTENQYSKGISNISGTFNFGRARGKYTAFCEGDDYWTDPLKLKKQTDYMEAHPDCSMCCHPARLEVLDRAFRSCRMLRPYEGTRILTPREVISQRALLPSASLLFRTGYSSALPDWYYDCGIGDIPIHLFMQMHGYVYYMDEPMSVYRTGRPGSWTTEMNRVTESELQKWEAYYRDMEKMFRAFDRDSGGIWREEVDDALGRIRFLTDLKEERFSSVNRAEYRPYLSELPGAERRLLKLRASFPALYDFLKKVYGFVKA